MHINWNEPLIRILTPTYQRARVKTLNPELLKEILFWDNFGCGVSLHWQHWIWYPVCMKRLMATDTPSIRTYITQACHTLCDMSTTHRVCNVHWIGKNKFYGRELVWHLLFSYYFRHTYTQFGELGYDRRRCISLWHERVLLKMFYVEYCTQVVIFNYLIHVFMRIFGS